MVESRCATVMQVQLRRRRLSMIRFSDSASMALVAAPMRIMRMSIRRYGRRYGRIFGTPKNGREIFSVDTGEIRWRTLELWPGPNPAPVERSWAPLWTLADYRAKEGRSELDVLWGLYRQRCEADGSRSFSAFPLWDHDRSEPRGERHWSFLKGLLAWDRTPGERRLRFLWLGSWSFDAPAAEEAQALEN